MELSSKNNCLGKDEALPWLNEVWKKDVVRKREKNDCVFGEGAGAGESYYLFIASEVSFAFLSITTSDIWCSQSASPWPNFCCHEVQVLSDFGCVLLSWHACIPSSYKSDQNNEPQRDLMKSGLDNPLHTSSLLGGRGEGGGGCCICHVPMQKYNCLLACGRLKAK